MVYLINQKAIISAPFYSFWLRIERSTTSLRAFSSDDKFQDKIIFENWAEDANLDDERTGYFKVKKLHTIWTILSYCMLYKLNIIWSI